jgi:hypothetical protein
MKEAAFGEAGGGADVVDARRRIAFGADNAYRRVDKLDLGLVLGLAMSYLPVGTIDTG